MSTAAAACLGQDTLVKEIFVHNEALLDKCVPYTLINRNSFSIPPSMHRTTDKKTFFFPT